MLVILGLLAGGILSGRSLIRAAELRGVGTEMQQFTTAAHTFHGKYHAIPGDMPNATRFWGDNTGYCDDGDNSNDGHPARGRVIAEFWNNECAAAIDGTHAADDLEAEYRLSVTEGLCALRVRRLF